MAAIRNKNTKPEQFIRKLLFAEGYRYRKNVRQIYGHPDIYLSKYRTAIFVNGCFWHRHAGCKYAYVPKTRTEFWQDKFMHNVERDAKVCEMLAAQNIKCMVIWECSVKKMYKDQKESAKKLDQIKLYLGGDKLYSEI